MSVISNTLPRRLSRDRDIHVIKKLIHLIHGEHDPYRIQHLHLTATYAKRIAIHIGGFSELDLIQLRFSAYAHDLLKEKFFDSSSTEIEVMGYRVPQNLNRYVRLNLATLEPFQLDDYFNTDVQLHALAAGIFLIKEFNISDPRILYPVFFHSCPILPVYESLDLHLRNFIDVLLLSDKLSSQHLKAGLGKKTRINLEQAIFGESGKEFNYTTGLFLARLIGQGSSSEEYSLKMTEYYYQRAVKLNPVLGLLNKCPTIDDLKG